MDEKDQKIEKLKAIAAETVDIKGIGMYTLGAYRRTLNEDQKEKIYSKINQIEINTGLEVAAEVYPFRKFWVAENYHQNFKKNNPNHPYIKNISDPRFKSFKFKFEDLIKD